MLNYALCENHEGYSLAIWTSSTDPRNCQQSHEVKDHARGQAIRETMKGEGNEILYQGCLEVSPGDQGPLQQLEQILEALSTGRMKKDKGVAELTRMSV